MKPKWTPRPDIKPGDIIGKPAGWTPESDLDHFMMRTAGLANGRSRSPVPVAAQHQARNTSDRQRRRRCEDGEAAIYSRNGADLTRRFRALKPVIDAIPAKSAIIDCELSPAMKPGCRASFPDEPRRQGSCPLPVVLRSPIA